MQNTTPNIKCLICFSFISKPQDDYPYCPRCRQNFKDKMHQDAINRVNSLDNQTKLAIDRLLHWKSLQRLKIDPDTGEERTLSQLFTIIRNIVDAHLEKRAYRTPSKPKRGRRRLVSLAELHRATEIDPRTMTPNELRKAIQQYFEVSRGTANKYMEQIFEQIRSQGNITKE